jgi:hypothetical protein
MKDVLIRIVEESESPLIAQNRVREYLQARVLDGLQREGAMVPLAFHGGTALRFIYRLPRHSEDLDFALEGEARLFNMGKTFKSVEREFHREGYDLDVKLSDSRVVQNARLRFSGLLFELGLSGQRDEIFTLKVEVDTKPPAGAVLETTVVRRHVTLQLHHHDRSSLLAGKIHAILQRKYTKGRDIYDLFWYLSDSKWPGPNLALLNNALAQTEWGGPIFTELNWRDIVQDRVGELDWKNVQNDVGPFLERRDELNLLTRENLLGLLE